MARSRQRRKQRQQDRAINADAAPANGGVAEELQDEADAAATADPRDDKPGITAADVSMSEEAREEFDRGLDEQMAEERAAEDAEEEGEYGDVSPAELIAAIGPLRRTRRHSLLPGIRMFTAMLEEARGGYAADRLEQMEEALGLDFNALEQEGILQIAMAEMDETGVPDVEHGVRLCLEARAQLAAQGGPPVAEDHGDGREAPASTDDTFEPQTEEGRRLAATGASQEDVEAMDAQVLEAAAEAEEEHDLPGPDEQ